MSKDNTNSPNIYLIGFMGVGKSAVGRALARALNMQFVDSDKAIERKEKKTISEVFEEKGEGYFRRLEREFIQSEHPRTGVVVACGGGLPIQPGMQELLNQKGLVICLFAKSETILKRTLGNSKRPLLNVENPVQRIQELMEEREPHYLKVGIGVSSEGRNIQDVVKSIIRIYRQHLPKNYSGKQKGRSITG